MLGFLVQILEQRFVQECGHSIHTEIHNEKLNRACKMLAETDTELAEIANSCGYPSIQYLYAVFKKHFGQTPKQYKREAGTKVCDKCNVYM